jgi:hypothetical protein
MTKPLTDEQRAVKARIGALEPLRALVAAEGFDALLTGLNGQRAAFLNDPLFNHLTGIVTTMTNLKDALDKEPTEVPAASDPDPAIDA